MRRILECLAAIWERGVWPTLGVFLFFWAEQNVCFWLITERCVAFSMDTERKPPPRHTCYCGNPASSSDRVEQWGGRNKTVQRSSSRGQPVAFPTTFLTHPQYSLSLFALDPARRAGNKSSHLTPKTRKHEVQFKFKNKYDLATLGPWWKDDLVAERRNVAVCTSRVEAVFQIEANWQPVTWSKGMSEHYPFSYHPIHATFQGTDKMEQMLHTFVLCCAERQWPTIDCCGK